MRWKTWHAGLYAFFTEACSNFFPAVSFSSKPVWTKNLIHQDELRNLAFIKRTRRGEAELMTMLCSLPILFKTLSLTNNLFSMFWPHWLLKACDCFMPVELFSLCCWGMLDFVRTLSGTNSCFINLTAWLGLFVWLVDVGILLGCGLVG